MQWFSSICVKPLKRWPTKLNLYSKFLWPCTFYGIPQAAVLKQWLLAILKSATAILTSIETRRRQEEVPFPQPLL
jgi:hypothetical protein